MAFLEWVITKSLMTIVIRYENGTPLGLLRKRRKYFSSNPPSLMMSMSTASM